MTRDTSPCPCAQLFADLLAGWTDVLERRLRPDLPADACPSVLVHAGCSAGCGVQTLLRLRVSALRPTRWVVRTAPPVPRRDAGDDAAGRSALLAASTVFMTSTRLHPSSVPSPFTAPSIRRLYFPPLGLWRDFLGRVQADGPVVDPLVASEVFSILVDDGMPVLDALDSAADLAG